MQIGQTPVPERIEKAIQTGSSASGVSFDYLARAAYRESTFRPDLVSGASSATGMFQFLDQTWLQLMKEEGPAVGLKSAAEAIEKNPQTGRYDVADPNMRQRVLDLRRDPTISSVMAGRFTARNQATLTQALGRAPSQGELYAAHVLGPAGGTRLVQMGRTNPAQVAASAFPEAAASNRAIFYTPEGTARTATQVLDVLARNFDQPLEAQAAAQPPMPILPPVGDTRAFNAQMSNLIQTQAQAYAAKDPAIFDPAATPDQTLKALRTTIGATSMPGETGGKPIEGGGRETGWRAKRSQDAFSALMRSDAADLNATPPVDLIQAGGGQAAVPVSKALPGLSGLSGVDAYAPLANRQPSTVDATQALVTGTIAEPGYRPSRILTDALKRGAPAQPLPVITESMGVPQAGRFSAARYVQQHPEAPAAASRLAAAPSAPPADAVRVRTQAISLAPAAPPPVVPPIAAAPVPVARRPAAAPPLDLLAASRRR